MRKLAWVSALSSLLFIGSPADAQRPQIVRSTEAAAWGPSVRLVEELRIGVLDGAEEYVFGRIQGLAVGRDGAIYVADGQVPVIRMYDSRGRFVRNIGREGEGPGEFRAFGGLRTLRDGRLAIWDNRNQRVSIVSPDGEFMDSHRVPSGLFSADIFEIDHAGRFYVRTWIISETDLQDRQDAWIRISASGEVLDTILVPRDPDPVASFVLSTPSGYARPFTRQLVSRLSPLGYLITGRNEEYAFELHRGGAAVLRVERAYTPIPLGRGERAEWEAWARSFERRAANPPSSPGVRVPSRRVRYSIPDTKPAYSELRTDSEGRIWVRRYVEAQSRPGPEREPGDDRPRVVWREPPTFDVFEPDGRFLGSVTLPWDAFFHDANGRHIWATVRGEFDESYVVRLRVEPVER